MKELEIYKGDFSGELNLVRPMKLSGGGLLKSLKRVYLRGQFDTGAISFSLHGSRDMRHWWTVARKRGSVLACPNLYFRFYKIEIKGLLGPHENLQGVTLILNPLTQSSSKK